MDNKLSKEELKDIYDLAYAQAYQATETPLKMEKFLKLFDVKKTDVVGDIACGNGILATLFQDKVESYYGIDFSSDQINFANKNIQDHNIQNATFICSDIIEYCSVNKNKFDKTFALDFTEHIYDEELLSIFESVKYSMKEDGILYIHTPNGKYFLEIFKNKGIMKQIRGHVAVRSAEEYHDLFINKLGFTNFKVHYISHYIPLLRFFHFLSYLPFTGSFFKARLLIVVGK